MGSPLLDYSRMALARSYRRPPHASGGKSGIGDLQLPFTVDTNAYYGGLNNYQYYGAIFLL